MHPTEYYAYYFQISRRQLYMLRMPRLKVCTALECDRYMKIHQSNKKDYVEVPCQTITYTCNKSVMKNRRG